MKTKTLIVAGIGLVLAFRLQSLHAQTTNTTPPGPAPLLVAPPPGTRPPLPRNRQPRPFMARALNDLRAVKVELQHSQEDFGGHKNSAIEACDKAMLELQAVMKFSTPQPSPIQSPQAPAGPAPAPAGPATAAPATPSTPGAPPAQPQQ
jgi:hypothetical protein